ncbi:MULTISPECIES: GNAT family N-acetyltransferase [unclassified Sphingomonas]|uniref:GNAT family N-acetyltransferase n=1 Tax=Novosphingobium rhizosphaerae TaxID=1551649 RepID=UPI0015CCB41C
MACRVYHAELAQVQDHPRLAALLARGHADGPFDRADWLSLLAARAFSGAHAFLAVAEDGDGAVLALPLVATRHGLGALANWYSFWARPLTDAPERAEAMLVALARDLARHGALDFAPLPAREAGWMARAFRTAGWVVAVEPAHVNRHMALDGQDFATWWATRPGALRATVRRKGASGAVQCRVGTAFDAGDWAAYEAIYAASWKPAEGDPAFLRAVAQGESAAGALRLGVATLNGQPVAAQMWSVEAGTAFIHKLAHRQDARGASPGTLLSAAMFAHVIDRDGVRAIDFGTGDDPYKADWMDQARTRWRLHAHHPAAWRHWPALLRGLVRRAAGRSRLAPPPADG